ncbi:kinetochore Sim4 complex subunit FTA2-domain-containing protein [Diaporthe sp. PMI_573]|nr:kinetochore Sim4 complex subunit FTA2-domain-containing protein [Diaporthaceae sp. PMI_573]
MVSSLSGSLTPQGYRDYYEPFNCECRVYGRLRQEGREDVAARAHGYILLSPDQERFITERHTGNPPLQDEGAGDGRPLNGDEGPWFRWEEHRGYHVRAIVKDLMVDGNGNLCGEFRSSQAPQMYEDLETLHSLGILVRDVHMGNYRDGKLVDFSRAFTMYHPGLDRPVEYLMERCRFEEGMNLLEMVEDDGNAPDASRVEFPQGLSRYLEGDVGIDPRDYNWRKWGDGDGFQPDDLFLSLEDETH